MHLVKSRRLKVLSLFALSLLLFDAAVYAKGHGTDPTQAITDTLTGAMDAVNHLVSPADTLTGAMDAVNHLVSPADTLTGCFNDTAGACAMLASVTQPIDATFSSTNGGSEQTVTVTGCSPTPASFTGDGTVHDITMEGPCAFTLTLPSGYVWASGGSGTSCSSGTCTTVDATYEAHGSTYYAAVFTGTSCSGGSCSGGSSATTSSTDYSTPSSVTVEAIVNASSWPSTGQEQIMEDSSGNNFFQLGAYNGGVDIRACGTDERPLGSLTANDWYMFAFTWSSSTSSLSWAIADVSGTGGGINMNDLSIVASNTISSCSNTVYNAPLDLGYSSSTVLNGYYFTGQIFGAAVYNTVHSLTVSQLQTDGGDIATGTKSSDSVALLNVQSAAITEQVVPTTLTISSVTFATVSFTPVTTSVTEKVTFTPQPGVTTSQSVTVSGCSASASSAAIDSVQLSFTATPSCELTYTAPTGNTSARWEFWNATASVGQTTYKFTTGASGDTLSIPIYFQYAVAPYYTAVSGTPSGDSLNYYYKSFGSALTYAMTTTSSTTVWPDAKTSATVGDNYVSATERYSASANTTVSAANLTGPDMSVYQQFGLTASYSGTVASGGAPSLACQTWGAASSDLLTTTGTVKWEDSGCAATVTKPGADFPGGGLRYETSFANFTVSGATTIAPSFYQQYQVTPGTGITKLQGDAFGSSTTDTTAGYFDDGATVTATGTAACAYTLSAPSWAYQFGGSPIQAMLNTTGSSFADYTSSSPPYVTFSASHVSAQLCVPSSTGYSLSAVKDDGASISWTGSLPVVSFRGSSSWEVDFSTPGSSVTPPPPPPTSVTTTTEVTTDLTTTSPVPAGPVPGGEFAIVILTLASFMVLAI
ncbi:MAG: hypothetical protein JRN50_04270, partial [Nitrososphaerota archaeon]|nr:hypothetical protein [Nitrososphaerota archaeon]